MDRREIKTRQAIRNAFLALRAHKPLERITVRELADRAEISKATFYLHYHDIYDLSESLQEDVIQRILSSVSRPDLFLTEPARFTQELYAAFFAQQSLIDILFSGAQASVLPIRIEQAVKAHIFSILPAYREDAAFNIRLTYQVQGAYYAYSENVRRFGAEAVMATLHELTDAIFSKQPASQDSPK